MTGPPASIATDALDDADDVLIVGPRPALVRAVVARLHERSAASATVPERVRLLCSSAAVDRAFDDFLTAVSAAEAIESGPLAIRTAEVDAALSVVDGTVRGRFVLPSGRDTESEAEAAVGPRALRGESSDDAVAAALAADYDGRWERAEPRSPDAPPRGKLIGSFGDRWPDAGADLDAAFEAAASGDDDALSPVVVCVLVGARHRLLSMRLGEWAEEVGFSSRTEVERAKSRLVGTGLVDTEREPVGVGRPRHRLVIADDELATATPETLVGRARDVLDE